MIASLSQADLIALGVFLLGFAGAALFPFLHSSFESMPRRRIQRRVQALNPNYQTESVTPLESTMTAQTGTETRWWLRQLHAVKIRIRAMGGKRLLSILTIASISAGIGAFFLSHTIFKLHESLQIIVPPGVAILTLVITIPMLEARRRQKFLDQFPDAIEYVIRSVRAGIPVSQAIRLAAPEIAQPLGGEFLRIGDSLAVGIDLKDALDDAAGRIALPDFTFFTVCLTLQRETGGQLTATLENLSNIIRQRREIRLKAQALTAEGRMSAKIIGSLPVLTLLALQLLSPDYVEVLFFDEQGRQYLGVAAGLLATGMFVINRMSDMKT